MYAVDYMSSSSICDEEAMIYKLLLDVRHCTLALTNSRPVALHREVSGYCNVPVNEPEHPTVEACGPDESTHSTGISLVRSSIESRILFVQLQD